MTPKAPTARIHRNWARPSANSRSAITDGTTSRVNTSSTPATCTLDVTTMPSTR